MFVSDTIEFRNFRFSPRLLELIRTIRVENLPPQVDNSYITIFFENPTNGGEGETNVQLLPEESSSLVEFSHYKGNQFLFFLDLYSYY